MFLSNSFISPLSLAHSPSISGFVLITPEAKGEKLEGCAAVATYVAGPPVDAPPFAELPIEQQLAVEI